MNSPIEKNNIIKYNYLEKENDKETLDKDYIFLKQPSTDRKRNFPIINKSNRNDLQESETVDSNDKAKHIHFRNGIVQLIEESDYPLVNNLKESEEIKSKIGEENKSETSERYRHKLVMRDQSEVDSNTGRSNEKYKFKSIHEVVKEIAGESLEEINEDSEQSMENIKIHDIFFEIIKLNYREFDLEEMKQFVSEPIPKGNIFMCNITRKSDGLEKFAPKYYMNVYNNNKFILSAKKLINSPNSKYEFSIDKEQFDEKFIVGRMSSNFIGTIFNLYDEGKHPSEVEYDEELRQQLASITYEVNLFGMKGPTRLKVYLPTLDKDIKNHYFSFKPLTVNMELIKNEESIHSRYKSNDRENIIRFVNKEPKWSEKYKAYVLNFNGRVFKKSAKNFQLISENSDRNSILLQFGKLNEKTYSLDFQSPLCPLQAFAICISCLDNKLACE